MARLLKVPAISPLDLPLLDDEFDKALTEPLDVDHMSFSSHLLDDLAWDDQLDSGLEMSL